MTSIVVPKPGKAEDEGENTPEERLMFERRFEEVLEELQVWSPDADRALLERAFEVARVAHAKQRRRSGEPYLVHPLRVARNIARLGLDPSSVAAGLMHDAVEDSDLTIYELAESFGRDIALLVDGVTKIGKIPYLSRQENQAESFRKMLLAMSQDIRVLLVKLADRLDNMQTLGAMPEAKRARIATETKEIYAPLAGRLGIDWLKRELQDLAFQNLENTIWREVRLRTDELLARDPRFIQDAEASLKECFSLSGPVELQNANDLGRDNLRWREELHGAVDIRHTLRTTFGIYQMLGDKSNEVDQISDLVSYQVITRTREGCYSALGQLHSRFQPVAEVQDYIAMPRTNRYQALHTTIVDRRGRRMAVEIRSEAMDAIAERGIIADLQRGGEGDSQRLAWLDTLMDWQKEVADPSEFIEAVKADLFADEIFVFTPDGDLKVFAKGATPIDFAFSIHSDVGLHCSGARVNGQAVPLRYKMRRGDSVEIFTNPTIFPRPEWVSICVSPRAKTRIKHFLRQRERTRLVEIGRSLIVQNLDGGEDSLKAMDEAEVWVKQLDRLEIAKERGPDGIFEEIGAGRLEPLDALEGLLNTRASDHSASSGIWHRVFRRVSGRGRGKGNESRVLAKGGEAGNPIVIDRQRISTPSGMLRLSECCSPVPGDPVLGFIDAGREISVHVQGCPRSEEHQGRRVYLTWASGLELERSVTLEVRTANTVGLLAEMSRVFSHHGVNIKQANCRTYEGGKRALNTFHGTVCSLTQLQSLIFDLKKTKGVLGVERVFDRDDA